jgi:hypothetical protein
VVGSWQVNKVGKGEFVPGEKLGLTKPLLIDFQDLLQLPNLLVDVLVVTIVFALWWEGKVAEQCPTRWVKGMLLVS